MPFSVLSEKNDRRYLRINFTSRSYLMQLMSLSPLNNYEFKVSVIELFENGIVSLLRGEKNVKPHPQNRILVPFRGSFQTFC